MVLISKRIGPFVLRLLAALWLLACPGMSRAAGTWSVISVQQKAGEVINPAALAVDGAGNLYVVDGINAGLRVDKRDSEGNWSTLATAGEALGQVSSPTALAVGAAGELYVADGDNPRFRIQKRDAQGNWSVIATGGNAPGQVFGTTGMAVDAAGNLYVADDGFTSNIQGRIQKRDTQGHWSVLATAGAGLGQVSYPDALAVDAEGSLYVAEQNPGRIQKRDSQGHWSVVATRSASALAVDTVGDLYIAGEGDANAAIQKRDARGNWSVIAAYGSDLGQVFGPTGLGVDAAGELYVTDQSDYGQIQKRDAQGHWSVVASGVTALGTAIAPVALAADAMGHLYVADLLRSGGSYGRIQERDPRGSWSMIATAGPDPGQVIFGYFCTGPGVAAALALDAEGNLYAADESHGVQLRDARGAWSLIAPQGGDIGQVGYPNALAADTAGNLYVAEGSRAIFGGQDRIQKRDVRGNWTVIATGAAGALAMDTAGNLYVAGDNIQKRDVQGNWSVIAGQGIAVGQVSLPTGLAVDATGNLYVADMVDPNTDASRIQKRDAQGNWSVIASVGSAVGQVSPSGLAVDTAGNLYVADTGNNRVLEYTPSGP